MAITIEIHKTAIAAVEVPEFIKEQRKSLCRKPTEDPVDG